MQIWLVRPTEGQKIVKRCPGCEAKRQFVSSGAFRVNAQKKRIDVWHIYKCERCDYTWNIDVIARVNRNNIDPVLYNMFLQNDQGEAWRRTFDYDLLRSNRAELAEPPDFEVIGQDLDALSHLGKTRIKVTYEFRLPVRLASVLTKKIGISRRRLDYLIDHGRFPGLSSEDTAKPLREGLEFEIDVEAVLAARAEYLASLSEVERPPVAASQKTPSRRRQWRRG